MRFNTNGTITAFDKSGYIVAANNSYTAGEMQHIKLVFNMYAGTSEMILNGQTLFENRSHGISDRGIGRLNTGYGSSSNGSTFNLDNLLVTTFDDLPLILDVDLEDKALGQPIGTGGAIIDEPVSIDPKIISEVINAGVGNRALLLEKHLDGVAQTARWEFLNDIEILSGIVSIEMDVEFDSLDGYQITVRENDSSDEHFANLLFFSDGRIVMTDANGTVGDVGTYVANQLYHIKFNFDLDNGSYTAVIDDEVLVQDRDYGDTNDRGIGPVVTGFIFNTSTCLFTIDNLQVYSSLVDELIFKENFE